ncbi:H-NS histone family protein [Variovorax sp. LjRoot175]|uniref:H-NS family nucleoid-associated regulatory protein n=1 Tax=Variovorax sp. LjRoot175 TaxID=3342276 RepID=UPI003ECDD376
MAQTYAQIQRKISALQKEAEALRKQEVAGVVSRIQIAIEHYGLTAEQLGLGRSTTAARSLPKTPKTKAGKSSSAAKYSDGNGGTWSGIGKRPYWLRDALAAGKSLDDFRTGNVAVATPKQKGKALMRRPSTVLYRDQNGNSWTGRGPQPRWLKEAVANGKALEELKA